jgi:hypothetical protein
VKATRARNWVRSCGATAALAACCVCVVVVGAGTPVGAADEATPSLDTLVIPDLGPGYTVTSQGPLNAAQFASNAPDPSAAAGALSTLAKTISTYERVWQAHGGLNQVQDLLVRFPDAVGAQVFLHAARHSLESGEIVSSDPLSSIPGARRVTYFAATNQDGVGEAITSRAGVYVDLLSFFSAASGNPQPISPANAERVARAQYAAMVRAPDDAQTSTPTSTPVHATKSVSAGTILEVVLVVAVLALAVATPCLPAAATDHAGRVDRDRAARRSFSRRLG